MNLKRIASLLPAATEIVAALGAFEKLVGRSHECDWPADVLKLPVLTQPKIDASFSSGGIDQQVRAVDSGSLFSLDQATLARLAPDLILTQATCRVCAIDVNEVAAVTAAINLPEGESPQVLTLSPQSLSDLFADIHRVGEAIGCQKGSGGVVAALQARCNAVRDRTAEAVQIAGRKPRVAIVEWLDPPMSAGNWVPELIRLAGGTDALDATSNNDNLANQIATNQPPKSHWISWSDLVSADPDVVLLTPCGFELERVLTEATSIAVWPHLANLRATHEGRLVAVDGHHLFNRPGPRLIDSLEVLAELLHPGTFVFETTQQFSRIVCR